MCTAITFKAKDFYFGRNLDLEYNYQESVTITPRNYPFTFQNKAHNAEHYEIIGVATVYDNYHLYYQGFYAVKIYLSLSNRQVYGIAYQDGNIQGKQTKSDRKQYQANEQKPMS